MLPEFNYLLDTNEAAKPLRSYLRWLEKLSICERLVSDLRNYYLIPLRKHCNSLSDGFCFLLLAKKISDLLSNQV